MDAEEYLKCSCIFFGSILCSLPFLLLVACAGCHCAERGPPPTLSFIQAHPPAPMLLCLIRSSLLLLAYDTRPGGDTTALRCSSQKAWTAPGGELRGYSFAGDLARGSTLATHPRLEARRNSTHRIADTAAFAGGCRALFAVRSGGRLSDSFSRSRSGIRSLSLRLETAGGGWAGLVNREW
ncbi:hypothetical protein C8J57DRAFT_1251107 [Mycena rebaudengoi]|nr:hypothetical protein C8J57DRAFT_1251107 [Mycena rebaudengoi]